MMVCKIIFSFLSFIDLFQQNVSLKLNNRFRVSISLGKFFSVGIIMFLLYNFFNSDMLRRMNPNILYQSTELANRPLINLSENDFIIAVALQDSKNAYFEDPSIFSFHALSNKVGDYNNFTTIYEDMEKCSNSYFQRFGDYFDKFRLREAYCLKNKDVKLKGFWDESELLYLNINLKKCVNSSNSDIICKSEQEISRFFADKYFTYWIEQKNIDLTNADSPLTSRIKNIYQGVDYNQAKISRLFVKKSVINLDNGIFSPDEDKIESYLISNIEYDVTTQLDVLFTLLFYSDDKIQLCQRKYQKLFDLIATLGGILNMFSIFCSVLVKLFHEWEINELILNQLYNFVGKYKMFVNKKPRLNQTSCDKKIHLKKKEIVKKSFIEKIKSLKLKGFRRFLLWFKPAKRRTLEERYYLKYLKNSNKKMDLIEVLKKLEEIDKIKSVIFDQEQLLVFNCINKKNVYLSQNEKNVAFLKYDLRLSEISNEEQKVVQRYFDKNKRDVISNNVDRKLISIVDRTLT